MLASKHAVMHINRVTHAYSHRRADEGVAKHRRFTILLVLTLDLHMQILWCWTISIGVSSMQRKALLHRLPTVSATLLWSSREPLMSCSITTLMLRRSMQREAAEFVHSQ